MPRKSNTKPSKKKRSQKRAQDEVAYSSLLEASKTKERLERLLQEGRQRGLRPWTREDLEKYLEEFRDLWPEEEIDAFLAWLYKSRHEGRY